MSDIQCPGRTWGPYVETLAAKSGQAILHTGSAAKDDGKIQKAAKEFESILLGSWLQQAEESFGSVPGGDDDDDADPGKEQLEGIAMQSLGTSMTEAGGIGIAKVISRQLQKVQNGQNMHDTVHPD